ncbi:hypothetical protein SCB49_08928 [unidentified eubacterium SCB49]|nr:hypothetical protein SCB49_08928 [unidentified eubacterium SCB49]
MVFRKVWCLYFFNFECTPKNQKQLFLVLILSSVCFRNDRVTKETEIETEIEIEIETEIEME